MGDEIKDLMEQISEGGRSIHEIEKQRKKLEGEKFELESALGDAEGALEQEENKLLRLNLEVNQVRADIEKRIQEKEEEFEGTKRNHAKQLEQMQYSIEAEGKAKAEAMRIRKKLELDINELESALEHAHMANMELQKNIKQYQDRIKEKMLQLEEEQHAKDNAREFMLAAEHKANSLQNALEETKTMLEQADRARKQSEQELTDTNETLADQTVQNQSLSTQKRRLEQDITDLRVRKLENFGLYIRNIRVLNPSLFLFFRDPVSYWIRELACVHESECTIMLQSKPVSDAGSTRGGSFDPESSQSLDRAACSGFWAGNSKDTIRAIQGRAHSISAVFAKLCR